MTICMSQDGGGAEEAGGGGGPLRGAAHPGGQVQEKWRERVHDPLER